MNLDLPGYTLKEILHVGVDTTIFSAEKKEDGSSVILKVSNSETVNTKVYARLKHEFKLSHDLNIEEIRTGFSLEFAGPRLFLVLEDFGGCSLKQVIDQTLNDMNLFFTLALQLAEGLGRLHHQNIIHKDIKPDNILVNPETKVAKYIDFGVATSLSREIQQIVNPEALEGTINYISPEQTGRMNRAIDYRSDIYSLGVTLYEMATGALPFFSSDPMEMLHKHIALKPTPPDAVNKNIPSAVASIILKCMEKDPEKRYHSAFGLKNDLVYCFKELLEKGAIIRFTPGENDVYDRFNLPTKLYGREEETKLLLEAFEESSVGKAKIFQVIGTGGIGKTSLINEILKPILGKRGYFISGKFEQLKQNVPYSALIQAIKELINQILGGSNEEIAQWKNRLQEAVGDNGAILTDFIPDLELIIGTQPPAPLLDLQAAEIRTKMTFASFIEAMLTPEHPIVMFIDDLQWVDVSTLKLLEFLTEHKELKYLLMIFSYRPEEIQESHPLRFTLQEIEKTEIPIENIIVPPLGISDITELISDTCHTQSEISQNLAKHVFQKTKGNPFFVMQFMKTLYKEKYLDFDQENKQWTWDLEKIEIMPATDNVGQLMSSKIGSLPEMTQEVLLVASAIGTTFDWSLLSKVVRGDGEKAVQGIYKALMEELILIVKGANSVNIKEVLSAEEGDDVTFAFQHDRIQTACYELIPESQRNEVHTRIGKEMLRNTSEQEIDKIILDIANQFNYGIETLTNEEERLQLARLNYKAGLKAKESSAYSQAQKYFSIGLGLLLKTSWTTQYAFTLSLYENIATCEMMRGNLEEAEKLFDIGIQNAKTLSEKARFYYLQINLYSSMAKYRNAVETFIKAMKLYHVNVEFPVKKSTLYWEKLKTIWLLWTRRLDQLPEISATVKPEAYWISSFYAAAAYALQRMGHLEITAFQSANVTFSKGVCEHSTMTLANLAVLYASDIYQKYKKAFELEEFSFKIASRYPKSSSSLTSQMFLLCAIEPYKRHLIEIMQPLRDLEKELMSSGIITWAGSCLSHLAFGKIMTDENMHNVYEELLRVQGQLYGRQKHGGGNVILLFLLEFTLAVLGRTEDRCESCPQELREYVVQGIPDPNFIPITYYVFFKVRLLLLHDRFEDIVSFGKETEKYPAIFSIGHPIWPYFRYSYSLGLVGACDDPTFRKKYQNKLHFYKKWLKNASEACPVNYSHRYLLYCGELERVRRNNKTALGLYQKALIDCKKSGYVWEEAMIYERIGWCYLQQQKQAMAEIFLNEAYRTYSSWGGVAKLEQMKTKYSELFGKISEKIFEQKITESSYNLQTDPLKGISMYLTTLASSGGIELDAVFPTIQKLFGHIHLDLLVKDILKTILLNAKAEKAALITKDNGSLEIVGEMTKGIKEPKLLPNIPISDKAHDLYVPAVETTCIAKSTVLINNLSADAKGLDDPFTKDHRTYSVMSIPLLYQRKLNGILYLHSKTNFSPEIVKKLEFIATNLSISLDHVQLYRSLEEKVEARTNELKETQTKLAGQAKMESFSLLSLGISHEISNPLNFVINYADICLETIDAMEEAAKIQEENGDTKFTRIKEVLHKLGLNLASIKERGVNTSRLVKKMMDFSLEKTSTFVTTPVHHAIEHSLERLVQNQQLAGKQIKVKITKMLDPRLGNVDILPIELERVFWNLLENAYNTLTEKKENSGEEFVPEINVSTKNLGNTCEIRILDNGMGISAAVAEKIFTPFTTKKKGGMGLALYLSKMIITSLHGGTIDFETKEGEYTEFTITLPLQQP